jgi:integrase/recombinase XerD
MSQLRTVESKRHQPRGDLRDAFLDFMLSREAMLCTRRTIEFYQFTLGKVLDLFESKEIFLCDEITRRDVRAYLTEMRKRELSDSYIHSHARAIRTFTRFLHNEGYIAEKIMFEMPKVANKRLPILTPDELKRVINACNTPRDKALIMLMVDTGLRRAEVCDFNWGDLEIRSGLVRVRRGKGRKARSVVVGVSTRRALLAYRRSISHGDIAPLFQTKSKTRLTHSGLRSALLRIGKLAGVHLSPHKLRRCFATFSLRSGMNPLHLQGLLGHSSLEMVRQYILMIDEDLIEAHKEFGPIDRFLK